MELRHLRYYIAVAELLHFGRAAKRLRISQPSLSHQIQQLEADLRVKLLERTRSRVELTEAGRAFLEEAREIVMRADRAALVAQHAAMRDGAGRLRVGSGLCTDHALVTRAVCVFNRRHSTVHVEIETMAVANQIAALRDGQLDVGFVRSASVEPPLAAVTLYIEPLVVALPKTHHLAARQRIPMSALASEELVLVPRHAVPVYYNTVLDAFRNAGFVPDAPNGADHLRLILGLVANGCGASIVPLSARTANARGVVFRALDGDDANVETALAWRRDASATVLDFVEIVRGLATRPSPEERQSA
jgi:DNA-binding transcriptional LysR family regulator